MTIAANDSFSAILVRNAALCELAHALFKARGQIWGGPQTLEQQPTSVRNEFLALADDILHEFDRPARVAGRIRRSV
jgi:hypothetical protein